MRWYPGRGRGRQSQRRQQLSRAYACDTTGFNAMRCMLQKMRKICSKIPLGVQRVDNSQQRSEGTVRNPRLCLHRSSVVFGKYSKVHLKGLVVKDCNPGGLAARARGGRHGHQRLQRHRHRQTLSFGSDVKWVALGHHTYWRVDVVQQVSVRVRAVKIGCLGRVDDTAAPNGKKGVDVVSLCKVGCCTKTHIGWLNPHLGMGRR